jgi:hypothetical protein
MLSTRSDALLAVAGTTQLCEIGMGINSSKENRFVLRACLSMNMLLAAGGTHLIHAGIGKEKGWVFIRDGGRRRDVCVTVGLEVFKESLTYLRCRERVAM